MIVVWTILLATVAASFTDWVCMDALVRRYYAQNPQTWRAGEGPARIIVSQIIGTVATAAIVLLSLRCPDRPVLLGLGIWCAGALPVTLQNLQWIRMSPVVAGGHAVARIMIATLLAAWLVGR
jgi:hypothetical protein